MKTLNTVPLFATRLLSFVFLLLSGLTVSIAQADPQATMFVWSDPAGAQVIVNGKVEATATPAEVAVPADKVINLVIKAEGYKTHLQRVGPLHENEILNLDIKLEPAAGTKEPAPIQEAAVQKAVIFKSNPIGAAVSLNGEILGNTPFTLRKGWSQDPVKLVFDLSGYEPVEREVTIPADTDSFEVSVDEFKALNGQVRLIFKYEGDDYAPAELASAEIYANDNPVKLTNGSIFGLGGKISNLMIVVPGHLPAFASADLTAKDETSVEVSLMPKPGIIEISREDAKPLKNADLRIKLGGSEIPATEENGKLLLEVPSRKKLELAVVAVGPGNSTQELKKLMVLVEPEQKHPVSLAMPSFANVVITPPSPPVIVPPTPTIARKQRLEVTMRIEPDGKCRVIKFHGQQADDLLQSEFRKAIAGNTRAEPKIVNGNAVNYQGPMVINWIKYSDGASKVEFVGTHMIVVKTGMGIQKSDAEGISRANVIFTVKIDGQGKVLESHPRPDLRPIQYDQRFITALKEFIGDLKFEPTTANGVGIVTEGLFLVTYSLDEA